MSLPDIFGLVPRQWQQHPSLISPRAIPAENPIKASTVTLQADNHVIRPRAEPTTSTHPWIGGKSTVPNSDPAMSSRDPVITPFSGWTTSPTTPTIPGQTVPTTPVLPYPSPSPRSNFTGTATWSVSPTTPPMPPPTTIATTPSQPTFDPSKEGKAGSSSNGVIIGTVAVAFVMLTVLGIWLFRRQNVKERGLFGYSGSKKWVDNEKGPYQAHHQPGYSGSPSPTHSYYDGIGYGHSDAYYYQYGNNLHNSNSISRGPQNNHPEMEEEDDNTRSGKARPQTLPNDTVVYWPPPPGLSPQGLSSTSPPPPPFAPLAEAAAAAEAAATSTLLKRSLTRNPQDHRRQEQLEHLLMLQRRQIRELQEIQQQHQRENPLSSVSAPHAPTQQDRQIWQQSDQEQRQQWLQQQQPLQLRGGRDNSGGIIVSGPVGAVRDPQDWGIYDDAGREGSGGGSSGSSGGGGHSQRVMQERKRDSGDSNEDEEGEAGEDAQQSLRQYITQMKADYEEQFRKHQEELDRLKAEQETQLQMLREQIKG
ncbi:hypothetical protein BGX30_008824 [Mortierella sp. GBA39]|nr:hypothetical protein BGX30_008824 [Mortierella sp. GBA39]